MREIGLIKQVQVQRSSLKAGQQPHSYYDPAPLLVVPGLRPTGEGVIGITATGEQVIDVHNSEHPASRQRAGRNGISIGFTSHYRTMRARFGPHLVDGIAGENILVETERKQALTSLEHGIVIKSAATGQFVYLTNVIVATPCVPFSQFAANRQDLADKELKHVLQFLDKGTRGFYTTLAGGQQATTIAAGDRIFALQEEV